MGYWRVCIPICLMVLVGGGCLVCPSIASAGIVLPGSKTYAGTYTPPEPGEAVSTFEKMLQDVTSNIWIVVIALFFLASAYFVVRVLFFTYSQEEAAAAKKNLSVTVVGTMVAGGSWIIYTALKYWLFS